MYYTENEMIDWSAVNGVIFNFEKEEEFAVVRATLGRISSQATYVPGDAQSLANAIWHASSSVRIGCEFHAVHGYTPGSNGPSDDRRG